MGPDSAGDRPVSYCSAKSAPSFNLTTKYDTRVTDGGSPQFDSADENRHLDVLFRNVEASWQGPIDTQDASSCGTRSSMCLSTRSGASGSIEIRTAQAVPKREVRRSSLAYADADYEIGPPVHQSASYGTTPAMVISLPRMRSRSSNASAWRNQLTEGSRNTPSSLIPGEPRETTMNRSNSGELAIGVTSLNEGMTIPDSLRPAAGPRGGGMSSGLTQTRRPQNPGLQTRILRRYGKRSVS